MCTKDFQSAYIVNIKKYIESCFRGQQRVEIYHITCENVYRNTHFHGKTPWSNITVSLKLGGVPGTYCKLMKDCYISL